MQHLTARERAVLILRDVLQWRAAEVAEALDTTPIAVNSIMQRARKKMRQCRTGPAELSDPSSEQARASVERYVAAFESYDIAAVVTMLKHDTVWEMPPFDSWYRGAETIGELMASESPGGQS